MEQPDPTAPPVQDPEAPTPEPGAEPTPAADPAAEPEQPTGEPEQPVAAEEPVPVDEADSTDLTTSEAIRHALNRTNELRNAVGKLGNGRAARELALAVTALEEAEMRLYRGTAIAIEVDPILEIEDLETTYDVSVAELLQTAREISPGQQ